MRVVVDSTARSLHVLADRLGTAAEPDPVQHIGTSARFAPTAELRISIERDRFVVLSDRDVLILNLRSAAGLRCASGSPHPDAVDPVPLK